jgi:hypothetical protein
MGHEKKAVVATAKRAVTFDANICASGTASHQQVLVQSARRTCRVVALPDGQTKSLAPKN